jgi:hypothetical protein
MTHYPHRIRLRGPWDCQPLVRVTVTRKGEVATKYGPLPPPCRMTLPCRWRDGGLGDFAGHVRFCRRFGYPGRIDSWERVWLTFAGVDEAAEVWLNGQLLGRCEGADSPFEFEVTELLRARNELVAVVEAPAGNGGLWGEVALEVRCTAFLRLVRAWVAEADGAPRLHVAGSVVGTSERPLELYVLRGGATVAYTTVEAVPAGQAFQVRSDEPVVGGAGEGSEPVRVELVNGGVIWYVAECLALPEREASISQEKGR